MKYRVFIAGVLLSLFVILESCEKDFLLEKTTTGIAPEKKSNSTFSSGDDNFAQDLMVLGRKLKNPYSVDNMKLAYESLRSKFPVLTETLNIRPTHLYVKFTPASQEEYQYLESITDVELFEYPLDYEILKRGVYYRDPNTADGLPNPQYASVPVGYTFPNVSYEILEELYIPELVENENLLGTVDALIDQSLILTDNLVGEVLRFSFLRRPSRWNPDGFIRTFDNITNGLIPLQGVKVRVRRWFTVKTAVTDARGYYRTGSYRRPVNYSIKWENDSYWDIRDGWIGQAKYDGPQQKGRWNLDIERWFGKTLGFATIHRGLQRYFYRDIVGLKRPGHQTKLKVNYHHDSQGTGVNWGNWDGTGLFPDIRIFGRSNNGGNRHPVNVLLSTTIHEIAHTSHLELIGNLQYVQVAKQIYESWADAVEFFVTRQEYLELGQINYDDPSLDNSGANDVDNKQEWDHNSDHDYTPLFIDFADAYNQGIERGNVVNRCPDGGWFDGNNCYFGTAPQGETAFIFSDNFYYTPVNCCDCPVPGSWFDGANCFAGEIPEDRIGFIWNDNWFLRPAGQGDLLYDEVSGYTMELLESRVLPHSYGLTSLRDALKANKPSGMTDKHIDLYLNYYFNL